MSRRKFDELTDFNPKSWLSSYQKSGVLYLLKMGLFYHGIGLVLIYAGSFAVVEVIPDYEVPTFPVSVSLAASSGPIEEILFFGIPYYLTFNHYAVLATGVIWSVAHILNTEIFNPSNLAYGGFLFSIPHIFFSLRTWISGKGWFAILFHSVWNVAMLLAFCGAGLRICTAFGEEKLFAIDMLNIIIAASLALIAYLLWKRYREKTYPIKYLIAGPAAVFVIAEILVNLVYFDVLSLNV